MLPGYLVPEHMLLASSTDPGELTLCLCGHPSIFSRVFIILKGENIVMMFSLRVRMYKSLVENKGEEKETPPGIRLS